VNVNIDAAGMSDYQQMVQDGCTVLYVGTATFQGGTVPGYTDCNSGAYATWPQTVDFHLCFKSPTTYANCQNPDNESGAGVPRRRARTRDRLPGNESVIGTSHHTHRPPLWDSVLHDSPAHFDQFAARVVGQQDAGVPTVMLEMTQGVDYTAYTDGLGNHLNCATASLLRPMCNPQFTGPMPSIRKMCRMQPATTRHWSARLLRLRNL